jgi:hypothetical protein
MNFKQIRNFEEGGPPMVGQSHSAPPYAGHAHFWERARSRRQFLKVAAGATGGILSSGLWIPGLVQAAIPATVDPKPIPGGFPGPGGEFFHFIFPGSGMEPSAITDFNGFVGLAHITGFGTKTETLTGATSRPFYDADMRFMEGVYIGVDGKPHHGTFGFF